MIAWPLLLGWQPIHIPFLGLAALAPPHQWVFNWASPLGSVAPTAVCRNHFLFQLFSAGLTDQASPLTFTPQCNWQVRESGDRLGHVGPSGRPGRE